MIVCKLNGRARGYEKLAFFDKLLSRFISKTIQDTAIVTMEDERELVCNIHGAISSDLEGLPRFLGHTSTLTVDLRKTHIYANKSSAVFVKIS